MIRRVDAAELRDAVAAVAAWLLDDEAGAPDPAVLGPAVRLAARTLSQLAPGSSVELRVPPFAAAQCIAGPRHTRGTPPNVVETDPRTWLLLATGLLAWDAAVADGRASVSGSRAAEIAALLPLTETPRPPANRAAV
jgi:hypothetical protein